MKQLYYFQTYDGAGDNINEREQVVLELPDNLEEEDSCESCVI